MKKHTSFKTGGNASYFVTPESTESLRKLICALNDNNEKYVVIGNGSNLLVSDSGFDGVVICIGKKMSDISVSGDKITALSGALLSKVANYALNNSLSGFEFASGIPGSIGGAVMMNAGAYGGEMKDVVISTEYIDENGLIKKVTGSDHCFGYRRSCFKNKDVILSTVIQLKKGSYDEIRALMDEFNSRRREKQPLEYPSAGSTFKRPEGYFAGKLIDDSGLRGYRLGGAMVSQKHCGFVINYDNATSSDIYNLMKYVQKEVYDKFNVILENEVRLLGDFN